MNGRESLGPKLIFHLKHLVGSAVVTSFLLSRILVAGAYPVPSWALVMATIMDMSENMSISKKLMHSSDHIKAGEGGEHLDPPLGEAPNQIGCVGVVLLVPITHE